MKLEVLLSVMNLNIKELKRFNITSDAIIINQCEKLDYQKKGKIKIYSFPEKGVGLSRNNALIRATGDILLFCIKL